MSDEKWYDDEKLVGGSYLSLKLGEEITLEVAEINKITDKPDYEPAKKDNTKQGFFFEFVGPQGILSASTYTLQSALKNAKIDIGDKINIKHPKHGEYIVTKL